ncbi:MAG: 50S ribosomal protein L22 [Alphaproteobacteria bacterium]|nr:50S ribosomal protein L22 [Alphaproteobacteria bacterium]
MESKASLRFSRISARKARLVADLVRGRDVEEALEVLTFTRKKSAPMIRKLIESALANAEEAGRRNGVDVDVDAMFVKTITVDEGASLRRFRPRAMGRATPILRKTSHIHVVLDAREEN